jgi:hypothetical protein
MIEASRNQWRASSTEFDDGESESILTKYAHNLIGCSYESVFGSLEEPKNERRWQ